MLESSEGGSGRGFYRHWRCEDLRGLDGTGSLRMAILSKRETGKSRRGSSWVGKRENEKVMTEA